jgi:hypothetical protein
MQAWEAERKRQQAAAAYQRYRQGEWADPQPPKSLWQKAGGWLQQNVVQPVQQAVPKVMNWVDQHQREIAIGIGIAAGVVAVVLSGGAATPLVAAAWVAGSAVVAGGVAAAGTVGLNAYFHRPLGTNVLQNLSYAAGAAAVTATAGFALAGGVVQQGLYAVGNTATRLCVTHPTACARVGAAFTLWDKVEDLGLQAKLALQTWQRDPRAADTALELQLERMDNTPGNTTFRKVQESLSTLVGRYGDDVAQLVKRFGNKGAELLARHQDEAVEILSRSIPAPGKWTDFVKSSQVRVAEVEDAFVSAPMPLILQEDLTVYRYWSDPQRQVGRWTTLNPNLSPDEARAILALPNDNLATDLSQFVIPKGTTILVGTAASQTHKGWAGAYAIGGGLQLYRVHRK